MSDVLGLTIYYHVYTPDRELMVSDSQAGDWVLSQLASQYTDATVTVNDRDTGEALTEAMPLKELLKVKDGLVAISLAKRAREDAA